MDKPGKIVISDTTAITYLSKIGAITLLKSLFKQIYIPMAVYKELTDPGDANPGSQEVKTLSWIKVEIVPEFEKISARFGRKLDPGERQAIGMALQKKADLLIIDERKGRLEAESLGIPITGMIGILLKAKEKKIIPTIKPYLNKLRLTNFKMGPSLYNKALMLAGESEIHGAKQKNA
ncbi:DUF3368 domain-containing protein [Agarilytica rhodophyticola]|uniref:DUF3368 domain-containing protein n=1 Tax=Agarilytica rhodophyticola TaxID=1737490 RepID=UPI000B345905|nr:DUF3368 domain-containing protein [Agarilytica rhodophyticola]